jgi:hypothetical protein
VASKNHVLKRSQLSAIRKNGCPTLVAQFATGWGF